MVMSVPRANHAGHSGSTPGGFMHRALNVFTNPCHLFPHIATNAERNYMQPRRSPSESLGLPGMKGSSSETEHRATCFLNTLSSRFITKAIFGDECRWNYMTLESEVRVRFPASPYKLAGM